MSLSLVADKLQQQISSASELNYPETVAAMCNISKEMRSLIQTKLEVAKEIASLEMRRIRLAMELDKHISSGQTGKDPKDLNPKET